MKQIVGLFEEKPDEKVRDSVSVLFSSHFDDF